MQAKQRKGVGGMGEVWELCGTGSRYLMRFLRHKRDVISSEAWQLRQCMELSHRTWAPRHQLTATGSKISLASSSAQREMIRAQQREEVSTFFVTSAKQHAQQVHTRRRHGRLELLGFLGKAQCLVVITHLHQPSPSNRAYESTQGEHRVEGKPPRMSRARGRARSSRGWPCRPSG